MILVNGSSGIGTGFSTEIPCYNPLVIIQYLLNKLENGNKQFQFAPFYRGFKGIIEPIDGKKYNVNIPIQINKNKVVINELPLGTSIEKYKEILENLLDDKNSLLKSFENSTSDEEGIHFIVQFKNEIPEDVKKYLKLTDSISTNNIHAFNHDDKLIKYDQIEQLIDDYFVVRFEYYVKRKAYLIENLEKICRILSNKARYIQEIIKGTIDLRNKSDTQIQSLLQSMKFDKQDGDYDYLLNMVMKSVSLENSQKIIKQFEEKQKELEIIKNTTEKQMWVNELKDLETTIKQVFK
jgi:DNA topoisomerase-2